MATYSHVFQSVEDLVAACDTAYADHKRASTVESMRGQSGWIGRAFSDWDDVKQSVGEVWQDGLDIFQEMLHELRGIELPQLTSRKRRLRWSPDSGDEVDIDRLRAGQDYWRESRREDVATQSTVAIVVNVCARGSVESEDVLWRGALAVVLADILEAAGHRVELWAACASSHSYADGSDSFHAVQLKSTDQPLDTATCVNAVSGWFFRTVFFQAFYTEERSTPQAGLGGYKPITNDSKEVRELIGNAPAFVIDGVWSMREAVDEAREIIAQIQPATV